jgi:rare lipoprotein A
MSRNITKHAFIISVLTLAGCSSTSVIEQQDGLNHSPPPAAELASIPDAIPRREPLSRYGNPVSYQVLGKEYKTLEDHRGYRETGIASWYGSKFHGRRTSSGEPYDMFAMTAAHKSLPLPSYARVTNLKNGRSVVLKINDRGPFHDNRLIDLSYTAAWKLGIVDEGTGLVEVTTLDPKTPAAKMQPETDLLAQVVDVETPPLPALFLQVGAFGDLTNANRMKSRLEEALRTDVRIEEYETLYRVRVGPITSTELYDHLTDRLNHMGIAGVRVVIR